MGAATGFREKQGPQGDGPMSAYEPDRSKVVSPIGFPESHVEARRPEPGSLPHKLPHESPFYDSSHHFEATNKR